MAIFQQAYSGYQDEITPVAWRPLVIFRYAIADVFSSRLFAVFFTLCFIPPLVLMCIIFMRYNMEMLIQFQIDVDELLPINAEFFATWMQRPQMTLSFLLILVIGPILVSPDLRNNALPLYLARPISKTNYILGKLLVLLVLGSLITWIPGLILISMQAYLAEDGWLLSNLRIPLAAITSSLVWIICISMMSLAISAWVKWKVIARLFFFGLIAVGSALGRVMSQVLDSWAGSVVSLFQSLEVMIYALYGVESRYEMPDWAAAAVFLGITVIATALLARKIRAYEVVA